MTDGPTPRATIGLGCADVAVIKGEAPRSRQFHDTYFDSQDGLSESRHVFLEGCHIPEMWQDQTMSVVGELGFGTGLNFLAVWQAWKNDSHRPERLHFISVEGFPMDRAQMTDSLQTWPDLAPMAEQLCRSYPDPQPGFHRIAFENGRVSLTLLLGPVLPMLESLDAQVDAWFLDGFAPDRNPDMWHPDVLQQVARLCKPNTRMSTFTVAGQVRRDLESVGFRVEKRPGWGRKREVLAGKYAQPSAESVQEPWYRLPAGEAKESKDVVIIGSGIAGAVAAHAFNGRGCKTKVLDSASQIAGGASATPSAVLMPRLTAGHSIDGQFYALAWRACLALIESLEADGYDLDHHACGSLRLAQDQAELERQNAIAENGLLPDSMLLSLGATEASEIAGLTIGHGGLFFPQGGTLSPQHLCKALLKDSHVILNQRCAQLHKHGDRWHVLDEQGQRVVDADLVILANSLSATNFSQANWLPTKGRLGQISRIQPSQESKPLSCVIAGEGYITPPRSGRNIVGATFDHVSGESLARGTPPPSAEADERNLSGVHRLASVFANELILDSAESWTGVRCTTPDHLPLVGVLPDYDAYNADFAELRHGHRWSQYPNARYHSGLGILTGLGAHGVIAAPLAAEHLVSQMLGEPSPLPRAIANGLHPARFIVRDLKRRRS